MRNDAEERSHDAKGIFCQLKRLNIEAKTRPLMEQKRDEVVTFLRE